MLNFFKFQVKNIQTKNALSVQSSEFASIFRENRQLVNFVYFIKYIIHKSERSPIQNRIFSTKKKQQRVLV